MSKEAIRGLVVFAALMLLLAAGIAFLPSIHKGISFRVRFADARGLCTGDAVMLHGKEIGAVESVKILDAGEEKHVEVTARLFRESRSDVRTGASAHVDDSNIFFARKCLRVEVPDSSAAQISDGELITGIVVPDEMDRRMKKFGDEFATMAVSEF